MQRALGGDVEQMLTIDRVFNFTTLQLLQARETYLWLAAFMDFVYIFLVIKKHEKKKH